MKGVILMRREMRLMLLGAVILSLLVVAHAGSDLGLAQGSPSQLVLAVARFDDRSNSGLANVGEGVADLLIERLVNAGYRVVERQEIEAILLERGLNPLLTGDMAQAARLVGADVLLIGSVTKVNIQESSFTLGFLTISGAKVTVDLSIRAVSVYTTEIMGATSVEAEAEGQTGFSLNLGQLLSTLSGWRANVCTGGFLSDKASYVQGEIVNFGYAPAAVGNYAVSVYDATGTNWIWGASYFNPNPGGCVTFSWDGREFWWPRNLVPPGTYRAYLCNNLSCSPGDPTLISSRSFTIVVGVPPSWLSEITVGTEEFSGTIVGQAVDAALDKLVVEIGSILQRIEPQVLAQRAQATQPQPEGQLKGRVIEIWADGTIVLDLGREQGVKQYDVFEVFDAVEVHDPATGAVIEVIPASETPKGEIVVSRVEEKVSLANKVGPDFPIKIGDLVVRKGV
jgi:hypothetical protein